MASIEFHDGIGILPDRFGKTDWSVVERITHFIASELQKHSGLTSPRQVLIVKSPHQTPLCSNAENLRCIALATEDNYWCQWAYQFAHEYMHHLIDGPMQGGLSGLQWFEETLCESASQFCLSLLANPTIWSQWGCSRYALSVQSYLDNRLYDVAPLRQDYYRCNSGDNHSQSGISLWLDTLSETSTPDNERYERSLYTAVASLILPVFLRMPRLWTIAGCIAPSEKWQSLEEFLTHMESAVAPDVEVSVRDMRMILLG